jgi:hypothetical protein
MRNFKDYYFVLGVSKTASREEIERAYRYALDVINTSDLGSFAENGAYRSLMRRDIDEAYECLSSPVSRRQYDFELGAALPPPSPPEQINPALRTANTRETIEFCFASMKKKKSRSLPALGKLLSTLLFLASVGGSAILGLDFLKTGNFNFISVKPLPAPAIPAPIPPAQPHDAPAEPSGQTPSPSSRQGYVKVYNIRYGGVISAANIQCRENPSPNAKILARMPRGAVVFVTKESKDSDGVTWYFVDNSGGKGWVREEDLKIYK